MSKYFFLSVAFVFWLVPFVFADELVVTYPTKQDSQDTRNEDMVELLRMALEKTVTTDGPFKLSPSVAFMNEARCREEIKTGKNINIIWASPTEEMEKDLYSIKIPLRKGILGYRVFLIRAEDAEKFAAIKTLEDLKKLTVGQDKSWGDVAVFKANEFKIEAGPDYEGLFAMLMNKRFDFFSRGVNEINREFESRKSKFPNMAIEKTILLYYPWPRFFYFSKNDKALSDRIEKGLNLMLADGSFEKTFLKYNQKAIDDLKLKDRKVFKIKNPSLPTSIKFDRPELWYDPLK